MKFSTVSVALFAISAVASPIADPRADAVALPHWKSWWSGLWGGSRNDNNSNSNNNGNNNNNQIINKIYIIPGGALISGNASNVPPASVPFTGTVANNRLYANSPSVGNVGTVAVGSDGKLQVVPNDSDAAAHDKWETTNGHLAPNGANVVSCPDAQGRTYLYAGVSCPGGSPVSLKSNKEMSGLTYASSF